MTTDPITITLAIFAVLLIRALGMWLENVWLDHLRRISRSDRPVGGFNFITWGVE